MIGSEEKEEIQKNIIEFTKETDLQIQLIDNYEDSLIFTLQNIQAQTNTNEIINLE